MSFWDAFFLCLIYLPLVLLWGFSLFDIFDREDLSGAWKAVWVAAVVLVPFFGTLVYLFVRRPGSRRDRGAATELTAARYAPSSTAEQLSLLAELHDRGKLTDAEFSIEKERLLGRAAAAAR